MVVSDGSDAASTTLAPKTVRVKSGGRVFYWAPGTNFELLPLAVGSKMICQGRGCERKGRAMGADLQRKPNEALTV